MRIFGWKEKNAMVFKGNDVLQAERLLLGYLASFGVTLDESAWNSARDTLARHNWRGNVRELENTMHRAVLLSMAEEVALVPPITAQAVKATINATLDRQGQLDSWRQHFAVHQFVSNTETATRMMAARTEGGMDAVKREQAGGDAGAGPT